MISDIKRSIILLADGAREDVFFDLLKSGEMPNLSRYLAESGFANKAVTSFPSTTGPAYLPFLTGALPGTCNVPGIRWLDKEKYRFPSPSLNRHRSYVGFESFLISRDIKPGLKTIFELVDDSYSIFNPITRGLKRGRNRTRYSRIWYWYYAHQTDHWSLADSAALKKTIKLISEGRFRFLFTVFPGIDEYSHLTNPLSDPVLDRYRYLDYSVGEIAKTLLKRGEWESTQLWIVSDHGLSKTDRHFCVNSFLDKHGLPPFFYPLVFNKRGKLSANMVSGNGMTHIYFRNSNGWRGRTTYKDILKISPGLLDDLLGEKAVDILACRDGDFIRVMSRRGSARLKLNANEILYEAVDRDPFGYDNLYGSMDPKTILEMTVDSEYPDAPFQITHLFAAPRTGDLIISAKPGFDLRLRYESPEHKSSHGSLHRSHMLVPVLCNKRFKERAMKTVDIFPTVLESLGERIPENIDGAALERI